MSDEIKKECKGCGHEEQKHNVLREPYGRLCVGCVDGGSTDPCRQFSS